MAAVITSIIDAVVGRLNGEAAAETPALAVPEGDTFAAESVFVIDIDQETTGLIVQVIPSSETTEDESRDADQTENTVEIGIFRRIETTETLSTVTAGLIELVESVRDFLRDDQGAIDEAPEGAEWQAVAGAVILRTEIDPLYDAARLREKRSFASVVRVTYKTDRERS